MPADATKQATPAPTNTRIHRDAEESEFVAASLAFRQGDYDMAYGRFMSLANEGDGRAARIALAMHRFGGALFDRDWDATTEELDDWTQLADADEHAEVASLRGAAFGAPKRAAAPDTSLLSISTFRADRHKR